MIVLLHVVSAHLGSLFCLTEPMSGSRADLQPSAEIALESTQLLAEAMQTVKDQVGALRMKALPPNLPFLRSQTHVTIMV